MKFVCDRCQTRYSIADEKVRQKILRIRCKTCGNVIVVQEAHPRGSAVSDGYPAEPRPSSSGNLQAASSSGPKSAPPSGPPAVPSSGPKAPPTPAKAPASGPKPPPLPRAAREPDRLGGHVEWYLAIDGEESGPFSRAEVAKRIHAAGPGKSVHVWKEGMATWKPPQEVSVVAHELGLLRPSPPSPRRPPAAAVPVAPVGKLDSEVTTTPLPLAGAAKAPAVAEAAPTEITAPELSGFSEITTKKGKELGQLAAVPPQDDFGEVTTKKTKDFRELVAAPPAASYTEATTKKGKNLRELEASAPTASGADLGEIDRTPPPIKPLPPVGSKVASPVAVAARVPPPPMPDPVVAFETPPPGPAPRPSTSFAVPRKPLAAPAPPFRLPPSPSAPTSSVSPGAPLAVAPSGPSAPFAVPATPVSSSPSAPFAVSSAPGGPPPYADALPTPRPVTVEPFGAPIVPPVPPELLLAPKGIAGLFQRQPGLKYVVAVLAIVGLIILLGLVILRGGQRTTESEPVSSPEPAPAKAEEPKLAVAEPPPPPSPPPQERPSPVAPVAPAVQPGGRHSAGSRGRSVRRATPAPAPERPPKQKSAPTPPRLAGARPNPFDDSRNVSQAQVTAVVRNPANQAGLKSCYERALKMDNHLTSGRIDVTVSIAASGAVQRVVLNAPSSFIMVEPCIKSAVKRWSFPPSVEDYATSFPLIMQGGM